MTDPTPKESADAAAEVRRLLDTSTFSLPDQGFIYFTAFFRARARWLKEHHPDRTLKECYNQTLFHAQDLAFDTCVNACMTDERSAN